MSVISYLQLIISAESSPLASPGIELTLSAYVPGKWNKGLSSTFQPPEEGRSVQWLKRCDKHGDKNEDNSPKNVMHKEKK